MKVKVYVNWDDAEILNEANYKKRFEEEVAEMVESEYEFSCWLDDNFDIAEIWKATEADRLEIRNNWKEFCEALVRNNSTYDYKEVEIEI